MFTVCALFILGAAATNIEETLPYYPLANNIVSRWYAIGLSANVNEYVDKTISMLVPYIQENGLDPMSLPEINEEFKVKPVLITYTARLRLHEGRMTGLVNAARVGDQTVNYLHRTVRVNIQLQFTDLQFAFRYLVKVMNIGPSGNLDATLSRMVVVLGLLIDFNNDEIHLKEFALRDIGSLRARVSDNNVTDWLVNPLLRVFTNIFDTTILRVVESNIKTAALRGIDKINDGLKNIISELETSHTYADFY